MRKRGKYRRYTEEDILAEAEEYLKDGVRMQDAANALCMPLSTIAWHLFYPLHDINYDLWRRVRDKVYYMKRINVGGRNNV